MKVHFIAIGGAVMHNLAMELKAQGHVVTGSDDQLYDPAKSRLESCGLRPDKLGWYPSKITADLNTVVLGMHAHADNPELLKAMELNLSILSFPEFVSQWIRNKHRIAVCGSHGKTTTTALIMHVLRKLNYDFDYLVGGLIEGFDRMVRLSPDSKVAVVEGDEYLSSKLDPSPKMLHYRGQTIIITGIAWDHMNVFPTWESYLATFRNLINQKQIEHLIYYRHDAQLAELVDERPTLQKTAYEKLATDDRGHIVYNDRHYPVQLFGDHNLSNACAAMLACGQLGITHDAFLNALHDFKGVGKRLQLIRTHPPVYRDFAHAPSKVKASIEAVRKKYPKAIVTALVELHTYSSLNKSFIHNYAETASEADHLIVYFDPQTVANKRLEKLDKADIVKAFRHPNMVVCCDSEELKEVLRSRMAETNCTLLMSSGNLGGIDLNSFSEARS